MAKKTRYILTMKSGREIPLTFPTAKAGGFPVR